MFVRECMHASESTLFLCVWKCTVCMRELFLDNQNFTPCKCIDFFSLSLSPSPRWNFCFYHRRSRVFHSRSRTKRKEGKGRAIREKKWQKRVYAARCLFIIRSCSTHLCDESAHRLNWMLFVNNTLCKMLLLNMANNIFLLVVGT